MKIAFFVPGLTCEKTGGLQRVGAMLASKLHLSGHDVVIFATGQGLVPGYPVHDGVRIISYMEPGHKISVNNIRAALQDLRRDVVVLMEAGGELFPVPLALCDTAVALCISEHNDPWLIENERISRASRIAFMKTADRIHLLHEGYRESLPPDLRERARIIPNAVLRQEDENYSNDSDMPAQSAPLNTRPKSVIVAARLADPVKQISWAVKAFALLPPACADWRLDIYGDGSNRVLLDLIQSLALEGRVFLHGYIENIRQAFLESRICALPSRHEGHPVALLDAMSAGVPTVGFAGCMALRLMVEQGVTGLLAPEMTVESLAQTLSELMLDEAKCAALGQNAFLRSDVFAPAKIIPQWENLLAECVEEAQRSAKQRRSREELEAWRLAIPREKERALRVHSAALRERITHHAG